MDADLNRATGLAEAAEGNSKRLNRVLQLTGFSDPVYAEAHVTVGALLHACVPAWARVIMGSSSTAEVMWHPWHV